MTAQEIRDQILIGKYTGDELRSFIRASHDSQKVANEHAGLVISSRLRPGMTVGFGDKGAPEWSKRHYVEGKIIKLNRTRAIVLAKGVRWTVPFDMLSIVGGKGAKTA